LEFASVKAARKHVGEIDPRWNQKKSKQDQPETHLEMKRDVSTSIENPDTRLKGELFFIFLFNL